MERYRILYVWKVLKGVVPNPGLDTQKENDYKGCMCAVPIKRDRKILGSFHVVEPKLLNVLQQELRDLKKCPLEDLKMHLDAFLTKVPDEPPCPDLVPGATDIILSKPSNSLLHQVPRAWREGLACGWSDQLKN